ncbi:MAG: UbiX family flavin prenyltransferase [Bacillaceae bacterium]|nr:UbiX family flavin prenyltransferase [Bacillaceae bacterium]
MKKKPILIVAITGASGAVYGIRLVQELVRKHCKVHLLITEAGWQVLHEELDWDVTDRDSAIQTYLAGGKPAVDVDLHYHGMREFTAPIASGSYRADAMVVIPCSMGTLSAIAHGSSRNLLERTADVMLKEKKKLLLVPRETPLNTIQLENMYRLSQTGAHILPAMPGFYHKPGTIDDLINFLVGKTMDALGIDHQLFQRWGEDDDG